jgi:hypothetical protein
MENGGIGIMDKETLSILLSFALFGLYFLVPLIPAILIYKIFPDTAVTTSGSLANFKINTSGAFAAYLATVLIAIYALSDTQTRILEIENPVAPTWTISGTLELRDFDNKIVENPAMFDQVCVSINPEIFTSVSGDINFQIPGTIEGMWPQRIITIDVTGFGRGKINLTSIDTEECEGITIDREKKTIRYEDPIIISALNYPTAQYNETEYMSPQ